MSPGASQPLKKQRATATPKLSSAADDAIARRRAELRRLAQQQQHPQAPSTTASGSGSSSGPQPGLFSSFGSTAAGASGVVKTTTTTQNSTSNVARRLDSDFKGRGGGSTTSAASASRPATTTTTAPAKKSSPALSSASPWGRTLGVQTTTTTAASASAGAPQTRSPPAQPTRIPSPKAQKSSPIAASSNNAFSTTTQTPKNNNKEGMIEDIDEPPLANEDAPASPRSRLPPPSLSPSRGTTAAAPLNHNSRRMVPTSTNRGANPQTNNNNSCAPVVVHSIAAQRLEQEVKEQEALKLKALRQVKELEDKLMELETTNNNNKNKNNSTSETPLESFLELVDTVGEAQAMDWARSQVTGNSNGAAAAPTPYKKTNGKVSCFLVCSYIYMYEVSGHLICSNLTNPLMFCHLTMSLGRIHGRSRDTQGGRASASTSGYASSQTRH